MYTKMNSSFMGTRNMKVVKIILRNNNNVQKSRNFAEKKYLIMQHCSGSVELTITCKQ